MEHSEGTFHGDGGLALYYQRWRPDGPPRSVLALVHGIGEHSGRYMNVVRAFTGRGHAVYGFDHRGHGRSPGPRGHIDRWEQYRGDVTAFLRVVGAREPDRLLFLLGHSLGALIVLDYILHHPEGLRGAIISGAPLEPVGVAKPHLVAVTRLLSRVWPRFTVPLGLDASALSRDPDVARAYREDPLVHGIATVRWGAECLARIGWVKSHAADVRLPILLIHGAADRLNSPDGSRRLFEGMKCADKSLRIFPGGYHEPHNDLDHAVVLEDVAQWLDRHL